MGAPSRILHTHPTPPAGINDENRPCAAHPPAPLPPSPPWDVQGAYLSPRVVNLLLQYAGQAVSYSHTWKLLKPHAQQILHRWVINNNNK
jgi:hypothetical protein